LLSVDRRLFLLDFLLSLTPPPFRTELAQNFSCRTRWPLRSSAVLSLAAALIDSLPSAWPTLADVGREFIPEPDGLERRPLMKRPRLVREIATFCRVISFLSPEVRRSRWASGPHSRRYARCFSLVTNDAAVERGKRQSRYVTFRGTRREAQAELIRLLNRSNKGTYVDPTKMTVAEYLEHWLRAILIAGSHPKLPHVTAALCDIS
jgi:hypothetical protein